jgi:hypothetical protein
LPGKKNLSWATFFSLNCTESMRSTSLLPLLSKERAGVRLPHRRIIIHDYLKNFEYFSGRKNYQEPENPY